MQSRRDRGSKPNEQFEADWRTLADSFQAVKRFIGEGYVNDNANINRMVSGYTIAYNMCTKHDSTHQGSNPQELLYKRVRKMVEDHLKEDVAPTVMNKTGDALLKSFQQQWDTHVILKKWVGLVFKYLDQYYTTMVHIDTTSVLMIGCFHSIIFEKKKDDLREVILANIEAERDGRSVDRAVLRAGIWLFFDMGLPTNCVYERDLEEHLIRHTRDYYKREAAKWLSQEGGQLTYLRKTESRILEETRRADTLLAPTTKAPLKAAIEEELLVKYSEHCLRDADAGTEALLVNNRSEDLGQMFRLYHNIKISLDFMASIVKEYIVKEGTAINTKFSGGEAGGPGSGEPASTVYIKGCLALHDHYTELFSDHLGNHEVFLKARKEAFEVFINPQQSDSYVLKQKTKDGSEVVTASELLSTYIDSIMKREVESEELLDTLVDKAVVLFTHIHDKDLFQQFYMKQMSRRLMHNKNQRLLDQERNLIIKLKMKMGSAFTSKLEGMLTDQDKSDALNRQFREFLDGQSVKLPIDFSPLVLTTVFWPAFKHDTLRPPEEIVQCVTQFEQFYDKNTQSRKLTWIHTLGQVTIQRKFPKGPPREMSVNPYQGCLLLLFNETGNLLVKDAVESLKLPFEEVKRGIHALAYGKFPVIKRSDGKTVKTVKEGDAFEVRRNS